MAEDISLQSCNKQTNWKQTNKKNRKKQINNKSYFLKTLFHLFFLLQLLLISHFVVLLDWPFKVLAYYNLYLLSSNIWRSYHLPIYLKIFIFLLLFCKFEDKFWSYIFYSLLFLFYGCNIFAHLFECSTCISFVSFSLPSTIAISSALYFVFFYFG